MQNNIDYWKRRQIREAFNVFSQAEVAADEIAKLYRKASAYMTAKIQGVYDKFKRKYGLTDEQAKQLLAAASDRGSIDAALQALKNGPQTEPVTELRKVVESAAYAARIRQMRELEISAGQVMNAIYKQELAKNSSLYQKLITDSYRKSIFAIQQRAGVAFSFSDVNPKLMDRLLHSKWSGKNYSVRLWGNTQEVAENVKEQIILGALTGKTEREMAEALNGTFAKGARVSRRLIRTESNYIFTQADMAARKECDIRRYMYLATLDMKTCAETCGKLDGRIFLVKDQKPGYNCPPMHPWCRCTTLAILSKDWIRRQTRRARDPVTGRTHKVPLSMTYDEWYKKYVQGWSNSENSHKGKNRETEIAKSKIESPEYGRRLSSLNEREKVSKTIASEMKEMLRHRNGTEYEDLAFVDSITGKALRRTDYNHRMSVLPNENMMKMVNHAKEYSVIAIHNHPHSGVPSVADVFSAYKKKYKYGLIAAHDGSIYKYSVTVNFSKPIYISALANLERGGYTESAKRMFINEASGAGVLIEVL